MKYLFWVCCLVIGVGCANDLDLVADFEETPVIYGLIDPFDTAQYVRIERVFVDKTTSALEIAKNPDSLYYDDIIVKLVRTKSGEEYVLSEVDGNQEGYVRDEGVFAQAPNIMYKIKTDDIPLIIGDTYELRIEGIFEDRDVTATTGLFEKPFFSSPEEGSLITFNRNLAVNINWNPRQDDPTIYTAAFYFQIFENRGGVETDTVVRWPILSNSPEVRVDALGVEFYSFLAGALEEDPNVTRRIGQAEFELVAGDEVVAQYVNVGQANLGITSSGEIPIFTNIDGGLGVFGSKTTEVRRDLQIRSVTKDSLRLSPITAALNFQ